MHRLRSTTILASACVAAGLLSAPFLAARKVGAQGSAREFTISGDHFAFSPVRLEVQKDDLVKITFHARDIAHSFTVDAYRIAKRAAAGQTIVFEFRADQTGTFPFYCNLSQDDRCKQMKGEVVVR